VNIVHVTPTLEVEAGGLSEAVFQIASCQAKAGHVVTVLTPKGKESPLLDTGRLRMKPLTVGLKGWGIPWGVGPLMNDLHPDQIHLHGLWEPFLHMVARWGRGNRVRTGWTSHGMEADGLQPQHRVLKALLRTVYRVSWRQADWIHVLNEDEAQHWASRTNGTLHRISNGARSIDPEGSPPAWLKLLEGKRLITFLGRLHPLKAPEVAAKAFLEIADQIPDAVLILAGSDSGMEKTVRDLMASHPAGGRIVLPGWVDAQAKAHVLARTHLFLHPSRSEGHSLALLEAAAHGLPVLMSESAGFPELAEAGGACVFPSTPEECADAILEMLADPEGLNEIGERGRALVTESYSWSSTAAKLLAAYSA